MEKKLSIQQARKILGLEASVDTDTLKSRYRELAKKHHPDRGGDAHTFSLVREAYDTLKNISVDDEIARDVEAMIFNEIFDSWLGAQDDAVRKTVTKQLNKLENEKI